MKSGSIHSWLNHRTVGLAKGGAGVGIGGAGNSYSKKLCHNLYSALDCVRVWNPSDTVDHTHHGGIFNFDFTSDGSVMAAACEQASILLFDPNNGKLIGARNNAHADCVNCIRFLDSRMFVTCSDDTTVCLWDLRNMSQNVCVLRGHTNWVKNVEYVPHSGMLVTSGFDGNVNIWDINSCTEGAAVSCRRAFHVKGLMRCRVFPDGSKLILSTSEGFLMVIHNLNLATLSRDLQGFRPNKYYKVQTGRSSIPGIDVHNGLFTARRNRVELISDFPLQDNAGMITSLDIHPQSWCIASRNTSSGEMSEWTCVHDVQGMPSDVQCGSFRPVPRRRGTHQQFFRVLTSESFNYQPSVRTNRTSSPQPREVNGAEPTPSVSEPMLNGNHENHENSELDDVDSDDSDMDDDVSVFVGGILRWAPATSMGTDRSEQVIRVELPATITWNGAPIERNSNSDSRSNAEAIGSSSQHSRASSPGHISGGSSVNERIRLLSAFDLLAGLQSSRSSVNLANNLPEDDHGDDLQLVAGWRHDNLVNVCRPCRRLTHYVDEPNVGRGYIKEISFGAGGRVIASPFGFGIRLLAFDANCGEMCDSVGLDAVPSKTPVQLREVVANVNHGSIVVTTRFAPGSSMLVTGSLSGKVCFHQPRW